MIRLILSSLLSVFFVFASTAQTIVPCGTDELELQLEKQYPEIIANKLAFQQSVAEWIQNNKDNSDVRDGATYIVPLVYHIIHDYGTENISDDQVRDDVRQLNLDWNKMNADTSSVIAEFKSIIGDIDVEFRLASKNPGGQCTNGIEHIHSLTTYSGGEQSKLSGWPRSMYVNIWTVKTLPSDPGTTLLAYAFQPATAAIPFLAPYDGIISRSDAIGTIGTSVTAYQRTTTHEMGHVFGLNHPWSSVNGPIGVECGDDGVFDTPITKGYFSTCPTPTTAQICTLGVVENYQNFMDYASCKFMFTDGQISVVHGALSAPTAERNLLSTPSNLLATGTDDTITTTCVPRIDFYPSIRTACVGASITFHDVSWAGTVSSREWNFGDGSPATSTEKDPIVTFPTPGWKTVTLTASNSAGSATETREQFVYISEDFGQHTAGWFESFEDPNSFTNDFIVQNRDGNVSTWQHITTTGYLSSSCAYLNNYLNLPGDIDNLITPSFDLSAGGPIYLNYRIACASHSSTADFINDALKIYSSTDCGKTWVLRNTLSGIPLANAGYFEASFLPQSSSQWAGKTILLPSAVYDNNVRFRFEYTTNGDGNNVYIDDINISSFPVGVDDPDASSFNLKIFPNPTSDVATVSLQQRLGSNVNVKMIDQIGRTVMVLYSGWLSEGSHEFEVSTSKLSGAGMYYLMVDDGLTISREKLIVQ